MRKGVRFLIPAIALLLILAMSGCGVSHKTPEGVVESLIQGYVKGDEKKVKDCYGQKKDTEESLQAEIDATMKYFEAHNVSELKLGECNTLSEDKDYSYVYILYNLVLENEQEYPCVGTYMVEKKEKKYYVLPPSKITEKMGKQAASDYAKFMTSDSYKDYTKAYNTFIKKNPGYEDKIASKLN